MKNRKKLPKHALVKAPVVIRPHDTLLDSKVAAAYQCVHKNLGVGATVESKPMSADDEFKSKFWNDNFRVTVDQIPGPISVAQMTQENHFVPHDREKLNKNIDETIDKFIALFAQI